MSSSNECLNKLGSPLAKWSEKKVPGSEMKPQTNFSQMRSSHQTNSLVTPRCKLSPAPGMRRISPGHLFNHPGSLSDIHIRSIFQHQNRSKRACYIFSHIFSSEIHHILNHSPCTEANFTIWKWEEKWCFHPPPKRLKRGGAEKISM